MIRWEYVSGAHPLPKGSFVEETCYFLIFQQLYLCRPWTDVDFAFEELRIDSFRGGRQAMSPMIFPSRRKIACCVANRVLSHTHKKSSRTRALLPDGFSTRWTRWHSLFSNVLLGVVRNFDLGAKGFLLRQESPHCRRGCPRCTSRSGS